MYKVYRHALSWTDKENWAWPAGDKKLVQVFDHVSDIDAFMRHVNKTDVCVQAGGACGVWPLRFSQLFDTVVTFEPQSENYHCLVENIQGAGNITVYNAPLANEYNTFSIKNDIIERENWGAGYIIPDANGLMSMRIDDLGLDACDLIQLDIEGYELQALMGGAETIGQYKPVIVLEEKPLNHVNGDPAKPRNWLENTFGYKLVESIHRDVVLKC